MANEKISQSALNARAAEAIGRAHDVFLRAYSPNNFYFHDFLNVFITLIQQPAVYVIYRQSAGGMLERHYILSRDKGFYTGIIEHLEEENPEDNPEKLFPIFSSASNLCTRNDEGELVKRTKYFLLISKVMGSAQNKKYELVKPVNTDEKDASNPFDYIAMCAKIFFDFGWKEYSKDFQILTYNYLQRSLSDLIQGHINRAEHSNDSARLIDLPPPSAQDAWYQKLSSDLSPLFEGLTSRLSYLTEMAGVRDELSSEDEQEAGPTLSNFFLATRTYTRHSARQPNRKRKFPGYQYDVQFLMPKKQEVELKNFFSWLQADGNDKKLTAYSDDSLGRKYLRQRKILNDEFFNILRSVEGPRKILDIYTSRIGPRARSFTDPIFETGLIDFREVFEDGGLTRVPGLKNLKSPGELSEHPDIQDGLRIVAAHYVFTQMARQAFGKNGTGRVKMILLPVMERGVVWGVSGHFYHANKSESFPIYDSQVWQAVFHLSIYVRSIIRKSSSDLLWADFSHLIVNSIAHFNSDSLTSSKNLEKSLKNLEQKSRAHGRLNPLGYPSFRGDGNILYCFPNPDREVDPVEIRGITEGNAFFQSVQNWSGIDERNYSQTIDEGMNALYNRIVLERMNQNRPLAKTKKRKAR
ncbi:MAG: hypothetical protein ABJO72_02760 [Hyphomicrobiales bacterium]